MSLIGVGFRRGMGHTRWPAGKTTLIRRHWSCYHRAHLTCAMWPSNKNQSNSFAHRSVRAKTRYRRRRIPSNQPIQWTEIVTRHRRNVPWGMFFCHEYYKCSCCDKAYCSKCIDSDHRLMPMTHVDKSFPSGRHPRYFCHTRFAIPWHRTLPLSSLDDCPVPDEHFQNSIPAPQDARHTQLLTRGDFDYWLRQLPHDKSPGDDELTHEKYCNILESL